MTVVGVNRDLEAAARRGSETPWRRALRSLLRKRVAAVAILLIVLIYGAGAYTFLDAVGLPTGLQDPVANNLTIRRPIRAVEGQPEPLGEFLARHEVSLDTVVASNADLEERFGPLTPATVLPDRTLLVIEEDEALQGPSADHLFGTDRLGRDLFSRTLFSSRTTIVVTMLAFLFGNIFLGLGLGLIAGYRGGWVDAVIMRMGDIVLAIPGLLVLIVVSAAFRDRWSDWIRSVDDFFGTTFLIDQGADHLSLLIFALSIFGWVGTARFVRAQTLALREQEFVLAAEAVGAGTVRILVRHLFPGVLPWIIVGMSATLGAVAAAEVGLTFLGLGIQPPTASFGAMITDAGGASTFNKHPYLLLVPALTVGVLIYCFNLLGDAINDVVNPRGR